jgi:beta-xylosidase
MNKYFLAMILISTVVFSAYGGGKANSKKALKNRKAQVEKSEAESSAAGSVRPIELADPHIFFDEDTYYLYGTGGRDGFWVYTSKDLVKWQGPAGVRGGYALMKGDSFGDTGFWAPQVFKHNNGLYYIVYTANEQIAIASSDSPLGPFKQDRISKISCEVRQIDPFIYFEGDKVWLYHVRLDEGNKLFVAEMEPDLSDIKPETVKFCLEAEAGTWEDTQSVEWRVAEGPTVFKRGDNYFLIYSANDFRNPDYAVGYAVSDSPDGKLTKYSLQPRARNCRWPMTLQACPRKNPSQAWAPCRMPA